jgi:hypothetical protein
MEDYAIERGLMFGGMQGRVLCWLYGVILDNRGVVEEAGHATFVSTFHPQPHVSLSTLTKRGHESATVVWVRSRATWWCLSRRRGWQ